MEKKRTSKLLLILNVVLLLMLVAIPVYAFYWNQPTANQNVGVNLGAEETLEITSRGFVVDETVVENNEKLLIPPTAHKTDSNEVYELVYQATLKRFSTDVGGYGSMLITSVTANEHLNVAVEYDDNYGMFTNDDEWVVTITISFKNEVGKAIFDNIVLPLEVIINFSLVYEAQ